MADLGDRAAAHGVLAGKQPGPPCSLPASIPLRPGTAGAKQGFGWPGAERKAGRLGCHMKSLPGSSFVMFGLKIKSPETPVAAIVAAIET